MAQRTRAGREVFWSEHDKSDYECPVCGRGEGPFHVHHKDGDRENNDPENLVGLCPPCHGRIHGRGTEDRVRVNRRRSGETLRCPSCAYCWTYTGDAEGRTSCPVCSSSVQFAPNSVSRDPSIAPEVVPSVPPDEILGGMEWNAIQALAAAHGVSGAGDGTREDVEAALRECRGEGVTLRCPRESCGRTWTYTGDNDHKTTCPTCNNSVRIERNRVDREDA